jgi:hemerythrin
VNKIDYLTWKQDYSVGVDRIDYQHKEILNVINFTINHCSGIEEKERAFFDSMIESSIKSIGEHFSTEEKIMEETGYPELAGHREEHEKMKKDLGIIIEDIKTGRKKLDLAEIVEFLKVWILKHIPDYDKAAAEYFRRGCSVQDQTAVN